MACLTSCREVGRNMVWVCGCVIIWHMATVACIGSVYVTALMTCETIVGDGSMGAGKRINIVMIEV